MGRIAQVSPLDAEVQGVGTRRERTEADDLLRMTEHRRSMHALRRAAAKAATEGVTTAAARPADVVPDNVTDLADIRARRSGHPAGSARVR
jgi:hypothetical protein